MTRINNFIAGEWVLPSSGEFAESLNPARMSDVVTRYPLRQRPMSTGLRGRCP
ncbi:MAG: hypothetical protein R2864_04910 [Syntrophotaleaceae bacterium]